MSFEMIVTQLESHIFTTPPTFHHPTIDYHNFKFGHIVDMIMQFFNQSLVNKFMGDSIVNQHYHFGLLDVTHNFQGFGR